jgi:tripartite-type tricarboxylate transporter receptor subunit TctC
LLLKKPLAVLNNVLVGRDYLGSWYGVGAPKGTSTKIIEKLNKEIDAVVAEPNVKARLVGLGLQPMSLTPAEFGKFIADQIEKWAKVIKSAGIKPE